MVRNAKQLNIRPEDLLELQTMSRANRLGGIEKEAGFTIYPYLFVLAESSRNLVQYVNQGCVEKRNIAL